MKNLQERVDAVPFWYHKIELPGGIATPGNLPAHPEAYRIPEDMAGMRVLDIGAWDGYWTWQALKRGADFVYAIEDFSDTVGAETNADRSRKWQTFDLCREALGYDYSQVMRYEMSAMEIGLLNGMIKPFDAVFCFGVLYHLRHPLYVLEQIRKVCRGTLYIETAILDNSKSAYGNYGYTGSECLAEFYPGSEYGLNESNWWVATLRGWVSMVHAAGFEDIECWRLTDTPKHISQCRGFIKATVAD